MRVHTGDVLIAIIVISIMVVMTAAVFDSSADGEERTVYVEETGNYYTTLKEAVNDAVDEGKNTAKITLTAEKEYVMDFSLRGCSLSITGQGFGTVVKKNYSKGHVEGSIDTITFKDLTLHTNNEGYTGFQTSGKEYYSNVRIENTLWTYGMLTVFENCTFVPLEDNYAIWCYGSKNMIVDKCEFQSIGKAILIYNENYTNSNVEIRNTKFTDSATTGEYDKAAIEIHTECGPKFTVSIDNCVAEGFSDKSYCKNNLWNSCKNFDIPQPSDTSLVIENGITKIVPNDVKAIILNENGTEHYDNLDDAFKDVGDGEELILLVNAILPEGFNKNITIRGAKMDVPNGDSLINLCVNEAITASTYMDLNIISSSESITANGVVMFKDCIVNVTINPGTDSAIIDDVIFFKNGKLISGTVTLCTDEKTVINLLADGCVLKKQGGVTKILCTIVLDLGDGIEEYLYSQYGGSFPDQLERIPVKSGYVFDGLYLGEIQYYDHNGKLSVEEKILNPKTTLTAKWTSSPTPPPTPPPVIIYTVSYDENGGSEDAPDSIKCVLGKEIIIEDYFGTKDGYKFVGWMCNGTTYQPGEKVKVRSDMKLVAIWEPAMHTVTFDTDGGSDAPDTMSVQDGCEFTIPDYKGTKDGYTFGGWSYNGEIYQTGSVLTMNHSDIMFKAVWNLDPVPSDDNTGIIVGIVAGAVAAVALIGGAVYFLRRK